MPRSGSELPRGRPTSALNPREQAMLARRLSLRITDPELRDRLVAYAEELEAEVAEVAAKEQITEAVPKTPKPLRIPAGTIRWEQAAPATALPTPTPGAYFSSTTNQL